MSTSVHTALQERETEHEQGVIFEATRLRVLKELTRQEWAALGKQIVKRREGSTWALVDWMLEGGREDRRWLGRGSYERAAVITGYSESYLSRLWAVGMAFPPDSRYPELSFTTHSVSLRVRPEIRGGALKTAVARQWSADDLTVHINGLETRQKSPGVTKQKPNRDYGYQSRQVRCPFCKQDFPIKGNKR